MIFNTLKVIMYRMKGSEFFNNLHIFCLSFEKEMYF